VDASRATGPRWHFTAAARRTRCSGIVDSNLRKLDREGKDIESSLNYDLRRAAAFAPIELRLEMRGMYRYMADAASFEECLTGRRFPVAQEADNVALERAYREAATTPGDAILVSLEAGSPSGRRWRRAVLSWCRSASSASGPVSCGARMTPVELAGVDWKLTRLGSGVVVADQRQPSLTLAADGRIAGFDGCNRLAGSYQVTGASITFSPLASTKMACLDGMEVERAFARARSGAQLQDRRHASRARMPTGLLARFEARATR
jgi:copper homeostasis protein (lipoprotein)